MRLAWVFGAAISLLVAGDAAAKPNKQIEALLAMTPDDFAAKTTLKDDPMEAGAQFSTQEGFQYRSGILGVLADGFLRAFVNKATGATKFQLYYFVNQDTPGWLFIRQANIMGAHGLKVVETEKVGSDVDCGRYSCMHLEQVVAPLTEEDLRWAAAQYQPGVDAGLKVRFKSQAGIDLDFTIVAAEAAGLLKRLDEYRSQHFGGR